MAARLVGLDRKLCLDAAKAFSRTLRMFCMNSLKIEPVGNCSVFVGGEQVH